MNRVLVVGGSGKLGRAVATRLALRGEAVILAARDQDKLRAAVDEISARVPGAVLTTMYIDLCNWETVRKAVEALRKGNQPLRAVINCAAGFYKGPFETIPLETLEAVVNANYVGSVCLLRLSVDLLVPSKEGVATDFVNITSISSATSLDIVRSSAPHIASKAALEIFDKVVGRELAKKGIRVTTVAPDTLVQGQDGGVQIQDVAALITGLLDLPAGIRLETLVVARVWGG